MALLKSLFKQYFISIEFIFRLAEISLISIAYWLTSTEISLLPYISPLKLLIFSCSALVLTTLFMMFANHCVMLYRISRCFFQGIYDDD